MSKPDRDKGSARNMRRTANTRIGREIFNIAMKRSDGCDHDVVWLSPMKDDAGCPYKEYRDGPFVDKLFEAGIVTSMSRAEVKKSLSLFWPSRGPHWDGIAYDKLTGNVLIVEAKGHVSEINSSCTATSAVSIKRIKDKLSEIAHKVFHVADYNEDIWFKKFYQTANRLAMLWLFRYCLKIENIRLVNLIFYGDDDVKGECELMFRDSLQKIHEKMGIGEDHELFNYVVDVYVNAGELKF